MAFQLWTRDEYGQGSIIATGESLSSIIKKGRDAVTTDNIDNALTAEDKIKNWESYFIYLAGDDDEIRPNVVYAGTGPANSHMVYLQEEDTNLMSVKLIETGLKPRFFIGTMDKKDLYAKTDKGKVASDFKMVDLSGKVCYFVKQVK